MIQQIFKEIVRFLGDDDGPTAVEYAVMLMLIILACIGIIQTIGQWAAGSFQNSVNEMDRAMGGG